MIRSMGIVVGTLLLCMSAGAAGETAADVSAVIKSRIEAAFPEVHVDKVRPAPWAGLYEVLTDSELVYTTADAGIVFSGNVVDLKTKQNLTRDRFNELRSIEWNSLPLELAVKTVKGDGSRQLAIFADPLCPYCQQLETQLQGITNTTIYLFVYPLESVHPGATEKARQIWCAADRSAGGVRGCSTTLLRPPPPTATRRD